MSTQDPSVDPSSGALPDVVPLTSTNGAGAARNGSAAAADAAQGAAVETATTCAACGAPLASDQRYCLACGQPASPVRLAFLDVLQGEYQPASGLGGAAHGGSGFGGPAPIGYYAAPPDPEGFLGSLRRYSGLLALTGVLLAALLIGLLVGHWITGGSGSGAVPGKQVIEVKGLSGAAPSSGSTAGSGAAGSTTGSSPSTATSKHQSPATEAKKEAKEIKEVKAATAPPAVHKKTSAQSLQKLNKTTGKQHAKEVNELIKGDEPIETGH